MTDMTSPASVYLGLGTNLGDRMENLRKALAMLARDMLVKDISSVYETEPVGYTDQPQFLNLACRAETELSPEEVFSTVKNIERTLGRTPTFPNGPRIIDIDILFYNDHVIETDSFTIPHPRLHERTFVLIPLADIAPNLMHPLLKKTVQDMKKEISADGVRLFNEQL